MSPAPDIFGNIMNLAVEPSRAVEAHLRKWLDTELAAVERYAGRTPPYYSRPQSYLKVNLLQGLPGEDMSPTIVIVTRGAAAHIERVGRTHNAPVDIGIAVVTSSFEGDGARESAGAIGAAVVMSMIHRRNLDGQIGGRLRVESWDDWRLDDLAGEEARTRAIMRLQFSLRANKVVDLEGGPDSPNPPIDPYPPPGDWPTALTHTETVSKEDHT